MSAMGITSLDGDMLYTIFHSANIGANNMSRIADPELDAILERTRTALSEEERMQAFIEAQTMLVEKAVILPIYAPINYSAMTTRIEGYVFSPMTNQLFLQGAYVVE